MNDQDKLETLTEASRIIVFILGYTFVTAHMAITAYVTLDWLCR